MRTFPTANLGNIQIIVAGNWGSMHPQENALPVLERMRAAALENIALLSDRQPSTLEVTGDPNNPNLPLVDVRTRDDTVARICLAVDGPLYARLAYQFGHELGHVLCNRWQGIPSNMPSAPCQWIEEALVEAFGLHGLRSLAVLWEKAPPRPYMADYDKHIATYADDTLKSHLELRQHRNIPDSPKSWYSALRVELDEATKLPGAPALFVPHIYDIFVAQPELREDLGALNRWPERSSVPVDRYMELWKQSCREIGTVGRLPDVLVESLGLV